MDGRPPLAVVRPCRPADRTELIRMRLSLWPESEEREVDELLLRPHSEYGVLVVERGTTGLCGFAEIGLRSYAEGCRTSPVAYLEGIWVDADSRRTGVGSRLVESAASWARARGLTELASDADLGNDASHAFHLSRGFDEVERIICFKRDLKE